MKRLDNMSAIVTGGGRGTGKAIAFYLASEGCDLTICSKNMKELRKTSKQIEDLGVTCLPVHADVTKKKDILNVVAKAMHNFKRIDILVNNAHLDLFKPIENMTEKEWLKIIDTNLGGTFLFAQAVLSHMINQEHGGIIINIASDTKPFPGMTAFCATKFGAIGFTESLAKEVEHEKIKVYAVCPRGLDADIYHSSGMRHSRHYSKDAVAGKVLYLVLHSKKIKTGTIMDV